MNHIFYNGDAKKIEVLDSRYYQSAKNKDVYYPGVTTILDVYYKGYGFYDWLKQVGYNADEILKKAADEGSMVHNMIDAFLKGETVKWANSSGGEGYPLNIWQMFCKFIEFMKAANPTVLAGEFSFCCEELRFGGTIDLICEIDGERWLIDHKTSNYIHKTHELQISAYATAWNVLNPDHRIDRCGVLWLKALTRGEDKKGKQLQGYGWTLKEFDRPYDDAFGIFKHAQAIWEEENPNFKPKNLIYDSEFSLEKLKKEVV